MLKSLSLIFGNPLCLSKLAQRRLIVRHAPALSGRLLDAGCGYRPYADLLRCDEYIGMDTSSRRGPDAVGSVLAIPFGSASFDSAICLEVIEHVPSPTTAVAELFRALKPGGRLYLTTPQMWYNHYEPHDYFRYTNHGLRRLLEDAGFAIEALERIGGFWQFLFVRATETSYRILRVVLFPLAIHNGFRNAVCRFLVGPLNLLGLMLVPLLDLFSKRDHMGWVVLARKPENPNEDRAGH